MTLQFTRLSDQLKFQQYVYISDFVKKQKLVFSWTASSFVQLALTIKTFWYVQTMLTESFIFRLRVNCLIYRNKFSVWQATFLFPSSHYALWTPGTVHIKTSLLMIRLCEPLIERKCMSPARYTADFISGVSCGILKPMKIRLIRLLFSCSYAEFCLKLEKKEIVYHGVNDGVHGQST